MPKALGSFGRSGEIRRQRKAKRSATILARTALTAVFILLVTSFVPLSLPSAEAATIPVFDLELNGGYDAPFALENLKPGDMGSKNVMLRNIGNVDGQIAIWISNIQEVDFAGDGAHLDDYLLFEVSCADLSTDIRMPCPIRSLPDAPVGGSYIWVLNVRAGQTIQINWFWEFVENYQPQNMAQGDSLSFDINYLLGDMPPPHLGMSWLEVDVLGRITTALLDTDGRTLGQVVASDEARSASLTIPEGASCVSEDNEIVNRIVISEEEGTLPVDDGQALIGPIYSMAAFTSLEEPAQVLLDKSASLRINYDPALLPSITETIGLYMHLDGSSWTPLTIAADSPSHIGQCEGLIDRSGQVGIIATFDPRESAYFLPSDLNIDPSKQVWWDPIVLASRIGKVVKVTVVLTNIGGVAGEQNVTLTINGHEVGTEEVSLGPLESKEVTFDLTGLDEGDYEIEVSGLSGHVVVATQVNWWLILTISCLAMAAVVAFVFSTRRWDEMKRRIDMLQSNVNNFESKLSESEMALAAMAGSQNAVIAINTSFKPEAKAATAPKSAHSVDEMLAAYVASSRSKDAQKEDEFWIGDSFNQVDQVETVPKLSPMNPPAPPAPKSNGKSLEEAITIEDSIQFEEEVETHQLKVAKEFILSRIRSQGQLVIDETPSGQNGLIAMAALSQLVEEGQVRSIQQKRQTIYKMNEP